LRPLRGRLSVTQGNRFRQLEDEQILGTLARLRDRIVERFPGSGLANVAEELMALGHETAARVAYLRRPQWIIRIAAGLGIAAMALVVVVIARTFQLPSGVEGLDELVQASDAAISDLLFLGASVFFLLTLETRLKRRRALAALHQLRSMAHIVDMHQLTKDPDRVASVSTNTASSPVRTLSPMELGRYLDYCSELLSLISKIAALHVQYFNEPVVLGAVNEIETLATCLSGKIWQKISLLNSAPARSR